MNEENKNVNLSNEEYIEKLENAIKDLNGYNDNLQQEKDFYKNIVEELKKYINDTENWYIDFVHSYIEKEPFIKVKKIKDKLEELEKGSNNGN